METARTEDADTFVVRKKRGPRGSGRYVSSGGGSGGWLRKGRPRHTTTQQKGFACCPVERTELPRTTPSYTQERALNMRKQRT